MSQTRVLAFGSFDILHEGHKYFLTEARKTGDYLTVVVSRDGYIRDSKRREPSVREEERVEAVTKLAIADEVMLGDEASGYGLLKELSFDVLVVGYDQKPSDTAIRRLLDDAGKKEVRLVRLPPYKPETYKSSLLRKA
ncbi:MAG: adenylyltransferase/cytidyltransferase family protein [Candidatus Andersenbacteria bacterium]|nr:adenylyltransferase/cytidyltransferase family protein [Candidatus Andersenbacteria bacterium]MBI3250963.1 adenylyltransferase/cytidyltransferase family protein [Candidatus Andersenbacteria bacterium]